MARDLMTIGLTTLDVVAHPIDRLTHTERAILVNRIACLPAGTAAGAALVAGKLGLRVSHAGAIGDDITGDFIRLGLERVGVDTGLLAVQQGLPSSTTLLAVESNGTRSSYHALGAAGKIAITAAIIDEARSSRFLHYGTVGGEFTDGGPGADLLATARAAGATVTCDLISPRPGAREEIERLLPHVDYFMPSATEAMMLSGAKSLSEAADAFLALGSKNCIIKNGADGAYLALDGGMRTTIPAHDIKPVDTTSCGDSFCAGFIAALANGMPPLEAARFASATASLVAMAPGTLGQLVDFASTLRAMRETPLRKA